MKKDKITEYLGVGRRKTAVAAIRLRPGTGKITVNNRKVEDYFSQSQKELFLLPLTRFNLADQFDLLIRVKGGGIESQSVAARLGVAKALIELDETKRGDLKALNYLTTDSRKRERKKYGLAGARKRFQFSKR